MTTASAAPTPIPIPPGYPAAKAQGLQEENARIEAARVDPVPKSNLPPPPQSTAIPRKAGIVNDLHEAPISGLVFRDNNLWKGPVQGGTWANVYAGACLNYPATGSPQGVQTHGCVYVVRIGEPGSDGRAPNEVIGLLRAPGSVADDLKVVSAQGTILTLATVSESDVPTGTTLKFDAATDEFSDVSASSP